ncbi:sensor histidine kinase [Nocardioides sp. J2M5]|uniref:sensor histidine kinase n=1 Tax=Nocardioides palaemonis TaxID=2829810 RepID=UPI001BAAA263|nr:sensor histidine kinase [Nocardioides palaemonis]MBS2940263.1 sensor histidine kinase [Nocardioides palaemonis]
MRWLTHPVVQFLAAGVVVLVLVGVATSWLSRDAADEEAIDDARTLTQVLGRSVAQPAVPRGLVSEDPAAIDRLDRKVLDRLLVGDVRRIKIWKADGTIVYSDRTELIGSVYPLDEDELEALREGHTDAELSDLSKPENRFERDLGPDLLEVYTQIWSPEGEPLLFEAYFTAGQIGRQREAVLARFLPITLGSLIVLLALTTPLVLLLARRIARGARVREELLQAAVRASDAERLRIARDLHDGVVQDLAGSSFALSTVSSSGSLEPQVRGELDEVSRSLRTSMRSLRSLLVEIYPPDLHAGGLAAALHDLVAPLTATGTAVDVDVSGDEEASEAVVALTWRVAQEAVRNVVHHASATRVSVTVRREGDSLVLEVVDDGRGFDRGVEEPEGHFGLRNLEGLVRESRGTLEVESAPGDGTALRMEVPVR